MDDEYGKRVEELGKQPPEIVEYPEMITYAEMAEEPKEAEEYPEVPTDGKPRKIKVKGKRKKTKAEKVFKAASAVVATVAAVVIIAPGIFPTDGTKVTFGDITARDTKIVYEITLEERSDNTLTAVLYNDFTEREKVIEGDSLKWTETSLQPNMKYTLAVKSGSKIIAEKEVSTIKPEDVPVTEWYADRFIETPDEGEETESEGPYTYGCNCKNDGNFQFVMQFIDENGWWSSFEATLTDAQGNVSTCTFTDDLHGMQTIPVRDVWEDKDYLEGTTATFVITCISTENIESGEKITLHESVVKI